MPAPLCKTIPFSLPRIPPEDMQSRARTFYESMQARRTVRTFSSEPVPLNLIQTCIQTAGTAPSGANRQPWHFAVVGDPAMKRRIREAAEQEEQEFYNTRAPQDWLDALAPLGTDADKPFLEIAPYLIVVFGQKNFTDAAGKKQKNYYVTESASIATGLLIAALHTSGLATLTHTPSPMKFLNSILDRPLSEKPLMVLVVGYPASDARVPDIQRKPLEAISSIHL